MPGASQQRIGWGSVGGFLDEASLVVLNALQVHAYRQSGIRKRKNDRFDA